ncbi:MAG TPA: LssY C-terminal domain-containing protein [Bryobacteraceae bacterium]|jgi:hypothetical protein
MFALASMRHVLLVLIALSFSVISLGAEIPAGAQLSIRLKNRLASKLARPGDPVSATLIAPVVVNGKELLPAGFLVSGQVADPSPAHKRLNHSVLLLHFGRLTGKANQTIDFRARVLDVDNARESVDAEGVIHGLRPLKRKPDTVEDLLMLAAAAHPAVFAGMELGKFVVAESEKPRIVYEPGVEMWLLLTSSLSISGDPQPEMVREPAALRSTQGLRALIDRLPQRTETRRGAKSDLVNLTFFGTRDQIKNAFLSAGWMTAQDLDVRTDVKTFLAVADHHSYRRGPVSTLMIAGETPALVFEKEMNTFSKRHHIRIWRTTQTYMGSPVWIGAATHDVGIVFSKEEKTFSHSVDPDIDLEREKIVNDLVFTGDVRAWGIIPRQDAPHKFQNATGDNLFTDGRIAAVWLKTEPETSMLQRPSQTSARPAARK